MYTLYIDELRGDGPLSEGVRLAKESFLTDAEWRRLQNKRAMQALGMSRLGGPPK